MPITGKEAILKAQLISAIQAGIAAECGYTVMTPNCIAGLAKGIADAIIPFLTANVQVDTHAVPGAGLIDSAFGSVTGSASSTPGTIS